MIKWISANMLLKECSSAKKYLVTAKYDGDENINGRRTFCMSYEKKEEKIPTWCFQESISNWKVSFWTEFPKPCQNYKRKISEFSDL